MDIYEKKCLVLETAKRKEGFYINENGLAKKQAKQQKKNNNKNPPKTNSMILYRRPNVVSMFFTVQFFQMFFYTPAPRRRRGVYCFTSVRLSYRPSVRPRYFSSHFSQ